jgi:hypothetical protein
MIRALLVALVVAATASGCNGNGKHASGGKASALPTLGVVWAPAQTGYGRIKPTTVDNGGDPSGIAEHVRWKGWATPRAVGTGKGWVPPDSGPYSAFRYKTVQVIAVNLGMCRGRLAYRTIEWRFPTSRKQRGGQFNICPAASDP